MKAKPNTEQFKPIKNPTDFLDGGITDVATASNLVELSPSTNEVIQTNKRVHREQKVFRLPLTLINELKRESYERSVKAGCRVTETEIVEQALKSFLNL
jgi:hypothetical protein